MRLARRIPFRALSTLPTGEKISFIALVAGRIVLVCLDVLGLLLIGAAASMISGNLPTNSFSNQVINFSLKISPVNGYATLAVVAAGFFIIKSILSSHLNTKLVNFGSRVETVRASELFESILEAPLDGRLSRRESDVVFALNRSVHVAYSQTVLTVATLIGELSLVAAISIYLFILSPVLFCFMAAYLSGFAALLHHLINKQIAKFSAVAVNAGIDAQETVLDTLANLRQIKSLGRISNFSHAFHAKRSRQSSAMGRVVALGYLPRYLTEIVLMVGIGALLLERAVAGPNATKPEVIAVFMAGALRLIASLVPLQTAASTLLVIEKEGALAIDLLDLPNQKVALGPKTPNLKPDIIFEEASYTYPSGQKASLSNVSLSLPFGTFAFLSGTSGSGKSTFADLLLGLRAPTRGRVTVGGVNASELSAQQSDLFGYVSQRVSLINGTLLQNISMEPGEEAGNYGKALRALKDAGLTDFLESLPEGLETTLGSNARDLSGGQLQRIGLARALYNDCKILVLDEVTSALDKQSRLDIEQTIKTLAGSITIVYISHQKIIDGVMATHLQIENGEVVVKTI